MKTATVLNALVASCLCICLTPVTSFALSEVRHRRDDTYEKIERQYLISAAHTVEAVCEPGDTLIKGYCDGENRAVSFEEHVYGVFLESSEMKADQKQGWACKPRLIHPQQVIYVESTAVCKKSPMT